MAQDVERRAKLDQLRRRWPRRNGWNEGKEKTVPLGERMSEMGVEDGEVLESFVHPDNAAATDIGNVSLWLDASLRSYTGCSPKFITFSFHFF